MSQADGEAKRDERLANPRLDVDDGRVARRDLRQMEVADAQDVADHSVSFTWANVSAAGSRRAPAGQTWGGPL